MGKSARAAPAIAAVGLLAAALAGWKANEGFSDLPYIPVNGDVPTIGYGATYYEDGTKVTLADAPITRQRAEELAAWQLSNVYMRCVVDALGETPVLPAELEIAVDFAGQYGCAAWRSSAMLRHMHAGDYTAACSAYLSYRYITDTEPHSSGWRAYKWGANGAPVRWKFDCSTPGNKTCAGVWTRQQARQQRCAEAQESRDD